MNRLGVYSYFDKNSHVLQKTRSDLAMYGIQRPEDLQDGGCNLPKEE